MSYRVTWTIDIDYVASPDEAAEEALRIQRDPESIATVFEVTEPGGRQRMIDLSADEQW